MTLITDIVDLTELTAEAREVEDPTTWNLGDLLPVREIPDVEYTITRGTITRGVAQYRSFDAPTPIGRRKASLGTTRQPILPLGQKLVIGEYDRILLQRAQGATNEALVRSIFDDNRSNVQSIRARVEIARGQVLSTGVFALEDENGLTDVAEFDVPEENLDIVPPALFSDDDFDLFGWFEDLNARYATVNDEGQGIGFLLTSGRVVAATRRNKQVIRAQYGPLATEGRVSANQLNAILADEGLPPFIVNDVKIDGKRLIPDHKLIAGPANPADLGRSVYGITVEALELVGSNAVDFVLQDAPGITSTVLKEDDAPKIWTKATATAMPVLDRPELLMTANVLAPNA